MLEVVFVSEVSAFPTGTTAGSGVFSATAATSVCLGVSMTGSAVCSDGIDGCSFVVSDVS